MYLQELLKRAFSKILPVPDKPINYSYTKDGHNRLFIIKGW